MDLYEMLKRGMSEDDIYKKYKEEMNKAGEKIKREKEIEQLRKEKEKVVDNARSNLATAMISYLRAIKAIDKEDGNKLHSEIKDILKADEQRMGGIESMYKMIKSIWDWSF